MSRLGALIPFTQQSVGAWGGPIVLASGGTFVFPAGNFILTTGTLSMLQWFDPVELKWRDATAYPQQFEYLSSDGCNYRLINLTGTLSAVTITAAGSGATNGIGPAQTGVTVAIAAAPSGGAPANATAYAIVGGSVPAPTVTQGGSGFIATPLVISDLPPPGGIRATATATISAAGVLTAVTSVNAGAGYTSTPNWYVIPQPAVWQGGPIAGNAAGTFPPPGLVHPLNLPPGSPYEGNKSVTGAQLTSNALTGSGTVTGINFIQVGQNYVTTAPAVTITGAGAATATTTIASGTIGPDTSYVQQQVQ